MTLTFPFTQICIFMSVLNYDQHFCRDDSCIDLKILLPRTWFTTSVQNTTGWISNTKTFALGGPDIASKIFTICFKIFPIYVQSASKIFPIPRPLCSVVRILQVKLTTCIESHAHAHCIPTNQPRFFSEKVQRDSEPGGHDARDRDGPDQLDLPDHLRPCHLPAVQPPGLLWRLSGLSPIIKFLTIMTNNFQISDIGTVEKIEAISLTYFLDQSEEWQVK